MIQINTDSFKQAWFTFDEIESVKRWIEDVENGRTYTEAEFYSKLEKRLFSNGRAHV